MKIKNLVRNKRGATALEYAVITLLVVIAIVALTSTPIKNIISNTFAVVGARVNVELPLAK